MALTSDDDNLRPAAATNEIATSSPETAFLDVPQEPQNIHKIDDGAARRVGPRQ